MPMLWKAAMPWPQKVGLITLFSCGLFVTMAAILRVVHLVAVSFLNHQPYNTHLTVVRTPSMAPSLLPLGQFARPLSR